MGKKIALAGAKKAPLHFREWREAAGLTQEEIAEALGVNHSHVSNVENGKAPWKQGFVEGFAAICRCPNPTDPIVRPPSTADDLLGQIEKIRILAEEVLRRNPVDKRG